MTQSDFAVNQIVRGARAGIFVILAFRKISDGSTVVDLKEVDATLSTTSRGQLSLPLDCIRMFQ